MVREGKTVPVWFLSALTIVVVLVGGVAWSLLGQADVEEFDQPTFPPGAKVRLDGPGTLAVPIGSRRMPAGWFPPGTYAYEVTFVDGSVFRSEPGALVVEVDRDRVVRCHMARRSCTVEAAGEVRAPSEGSR